MDYQAKQQHLNNRMATNMNPLVNNSPATVSAQQKQQHRSDNQPPSYGIPRPTPSIYDFRPLTSIGAGAFAQVYKGYELMAPMPQAYREVALKRINLFAIKDKAVLKTTLNEVELFKKLSHENIVQCFYSFEEISPFSGNKYLVLVLEYVSGGDLQSWLQGRAFQLNTLLVECEIWQIFSQITSAVHYIHSKHVMHRDLKPPNVLMTAHQSVKLADFGLSRLQNRGESRLNTVCGTPYYMSPERIVEKPYTFKSDIWSLGCILYEMATLKSPFFGEKENVTSLIQKIGDAEYPPIPQDCYSIQLELLIKACLESDMDRRPSAEEVHRVALNMADRFPMPAPSPNGIMGGAGGGSSNGYSKMEAHHDHQGADGYGTRVNNSGNY